MNDYRTVALALAALISVPLSTVQADILVGNGSTSTETHLVTDASGGLLSMGFAAVGSFDLSDAEIASSANSPDAGTVLGANFSAQGEAVVGAGAIPGLFTVTVGCPDVGSPLLGKPIFILLGNGPAIETSSAFLVFKHDTVFAVPPPNQFLPIGDILYLDEAAGSVVVGDFGKFDVGVEPIESGPAFSLSESGSVTIANFPRTLNVEPGGGLTEMLVTSPPGATFSLVEGPPWVTLEESGALSANPPPTGAVGFHTIRVFGSLEGSGSFETQLVIDVSAKFAKWQERNFNLPAEAAIAGPLEDPDRDGVPNFYEYAVRDEHAVDSSGKAQPTLVRDQAGHLRVSLDVRDDDPSLFVSFEETADLTFTDTLTASLPFLPAPPVLTGTEVSLGGGMKRVTYRDSLPAGEGASSARFVRAVLSDGQ